MGKPVPLKDIEAFGIALKDAAPGEYCPVSMIMGYDTYNETLRNLERRNQELETNWHPIATKKLRDLAVDSGIPLSVIAKAAKDETYYKLRVPDRVIDEYKKWRAVYLMSKRIRKNG